VRTRLADVLETADSNVSYVVRRGTVLLRPEYSVPKTKWTKEPRVVFPDGSTELTHGETRCNAGVGPNAVPNAKRTNFCIRLHRR